ncbi:hypothetical protein CHGG_00551 [Chaetomium globosum CBS 148.51]|uniref:F-box domain-containing protein n=1 Tax=Chaetomium globosum (strain ATCC 6205 / CBS 148.51 / DSM 1962 / NBRC 6347 / NRRL 1970) TaxID=306901 RepID=Q2HGV3_CHAGB|nr:uncharacterized protein CHGG_00551 [Chaetomium globosum CBS 148.51]EAQ92316.1 hypothetical protein CHGG_00551 [Chaetomium globosum CBS 148.51]
MVIEAFNLQVKTGLSPPLLPGAMSLVQLPYELVAFVVQDLDLADIRNLSYSCKKFRFLVEESQITKQLLQSRAPYSTEARDAQKSENHAAGLRRLIKRQDAIASVSPYAAAIVAVTQEWIYENGVLCHFLDGELCILDLHHSDDSETVVVLRKLAREVIPEARASHRFKLKLLYYSHDIISLAYSFRSADKPGFNHYLIAFKPLTGEIVCVTPLDSISKLFVRNDDKFLVYGITSEPDEQGNEIWDIRAFSFESGIWLPDHLDLDVIGTDIGSTVCFEIFDRRFYILSSLRSLNVEEVDWVSYYYCLRFPLMQKDGFGRIEELDPAPNIWRRDQTEGPIDDRWTFLRLVKDEATGQLKAVESRKEWVNGRIIGRRTCYTTIINFDEMAEEDGGSAISVTKTQQGTGPRRWPRSPHMVHPEDDGSAQGITLTKCSVRSYYSGCQTAIDLVDDSGSFDPRDQQLRLRGSTRRPWTPGELAQSSLPAAPEGDQDDEALQRQIDNIYKSNASVFWPPKKDPAVDDPALAQLHAILNPPGFTGNTHGSWDERSIVYATGRVDKGLKALIFVSWDPSIRLADTTPYPGDLGIDRPESWAYSPMPSPAPKAPMESKDEGEDKGVADTGNRDTHSSGASQPRPLLSWRKFQPAMYRGISRGFHFCR